MSQCHICKKIMDTGHPADENLGGDCAACMAAEDPDVAFRLSGEFLREFKSLVRQYAPTYDQRWVSDLQDRANCFNPYIWSDK